MKRLSKIHQRLLNMKKSTVAGAARNVPHDARLSVKGRLGGFCNLTACMALNSAYYHNSSTNAYYCLECAVDIGGFSLRTHQDPMDIFPQFDQNHEYHVKAVPPATEGIALAQAALVERYGKCRLIYNERQNALQGKLA